MQGTALLILSPFVFIMISDNFCICIFSGYVVCRWPCTRDCCSVSTFNDCELAKTVHLSGNVYNDSLVTIKMREDKNNQRPRYAKYVSVNYSHAWKCKQLDRTLISWVDYQYQSINQSINLNQIWMLKSLEKKSKNASQHLQSIYVTRDRVILKFEARVQIYFTVLNIGCKNQNSGDNVVSFSKINSCEISL